MTAMAATSSSSEMSDRRPRKQCAKCPWKRDVDPRTIPNGYSRALHKRLSCTIAEPGSLRSATSMMACHESPIGREVVCVGWLVHQLGPGNNIGLRLSVLSGKIDANVETVGDQCDTLEETLRARRRKR